MSRDDPLNPIDEDGNSDDRLGSFGVGGCGECCGLRGGRSDGEGSVVGDELSDGGVELGNGAPGLRTGKALLVPPVDERHLLGENERPGYQGLECLLIPTAAEPLVEVSHRSLEGVERGRVEGLRGGDGRAVDGLLVGRLGTAQLG